MNPFNPLPTLKQQFTQQYYEPVAKELPASMQARFDAAKERYEKEHGHQFPYGFDAWCKSFYGR